MSVVCVRSPHVSKGAPNDADHNANETDLNTLNERIMNEINASGEAYLSHTKLNGKYTLRLSVGSIRVEERHLTKVWKILNEKLKELA